MQPSEVLNMAIAAGAHLMEKAHLASSTTTNPATDINTSPMPTGAAPFVSNSTVWITTTISATTQFVAVTASNAPATPSTSWVTATADATTTSVDWTMYPAVPITLTTSTSASSPPPTSVEPLDPEPTDSGPAIDPEYQPPAPTPTLSGPWCNVESEFPKHDYQAQILTKFIKYSAHKFCDRWQDNDLSPETKEISVVSHDENDTQYHYKLSWEKGCTAATSQNIGFPMGEDGPSCRKLLTDIDKKCYKFNHGVGGMYKAGCIKYEFVGGELPAGRQ